MTDFPLTGPDGKSYNVTADSLDLAQKALDYEFANKAPAQAAAATSPEPETRSFGSMLSGLVPGMGPKGWGPQNWEPPGYNAADAAVHGATFGGSDYLRGFARDLRDTIRPPTDFGGGGDYPTQTEQGGGLDIKNERDRFAAEHPYANIGANLAGAVATAPALPVGRALGAAGRITDPLLRRAAQWGANIGIGAGLGGAGAALDEAPEGFGPAAKAAGTGALIGGGVGAAAYPLGQAIGASARRIGDYFASAPARAELGVGQPAIGAVQRGLTSDQAFGGGQGAQNIARAGPYGMAADAGPTTTGMLDEAISSGGPGALTARNAIMQRGVDANRTLTGALDTALGPPEGIETATRAVRAAGAPGKAAAYEAAYAQPIDYSAPGGFRLEGLLRRVPNGALQAANDLMRTEGHASRQILADVAADGTVTYRTMPDMRQVDYIKRGLQQMAEAGEGAGLLGGRTPISRARMGLASQIRDEARDLVPEYGTALRLAGDDIGHVNALQFGGEMMSKGVARDEARLTLATMSPHDRVAVQQGVRAKIDEAVANVRNYVSNPNYDAKQATEALKDLNSQAGREKLAMVVTDPLQLAQLQRELDMATAAAELVANTAQNSKTAGRLVTREAIGQATAPGMVGQAMEGRPWETLRSLWTTFTGRTPAEKLRVSDEMRGQIADLLTRQRDPATGRSVVDAIEGILPGLARSGERSRALGAIPGIMLPPEVEAARRYMKGPPVPRGVLPPVDTGQAATAGGGGDGYGEEPVEGQATARPFAGAGGAGEATATLPETLDLSGQPAAGPPTARGQEGAPTPDQPRMMMQQPDGTWAPYKAPSSPDPVELAKQLTGVADVQQAAQAWQRGEYPQAIGQGAWGAAQGAALLAPYAAPAWRGVRALAESPLGRSVARTAEELIADTQGSVPRRPRGSEPITMPPSVEEATAARAAERAVPEMATEAAPAAKETEAAIPTQRFDWTSGAGPQTTAIGDTRVTYTVAQDGQSAEISVIRTPAEQRGQGSGRAALEQMVSEADRNGIELRLTSDPMDAATSKTQLDRFYQSLGFQRNAGRNRDFTTRAEFIRPAAVPEGPVPEGVRAPGVAAEAPVPAGIRAYHGSPHDFAPEPGYPLGRFRDDKIGTGEGVQAIAYGHYSAEREATGQSYRDQLAGYDFSKTKSGVPISSDLSRMLREGYEAAASQGVRGPSFNDAVFMARQNLQRQNADALKAGDMDWYKRIADQSAELERVSKDVPARSGKMYELNIKADPEHFLDWDKPLSEQSQYVQEALTPYRDLLTLRDPTTGLPAPEYGEPIGAEIYRKISDKLGVPQGPNDLGGWRVGGPATSSDLSQRGILGVRYLDQGSRGAGQGTSNYVVFDPRIIEILRKYGLAGLIAGGGASGLMPGETGQ